MYTQLSTASILGLGLCACLSVSAATNSSNSSDAFLNPSANYTPDYTTSKANLAHPMTAFKSNSGFFIALGASYTHMKLPDFVYGNKLGANRYPTPSAAFRFKNHVSTVMPSLEIGKYFYDNRFLPMILGERLGVVLQGSYWSAKNTVGIDQTANAYFWPIDGSEQPNFFHMDDVLQDVRFSFKNRYWHGAALLTGHATLGSSKIAQFSRDVRIGFVYYNLYQNANFSGTRVISSGYYPEYDRPQTLTETTNTNYFGGQIGTTLNAQFNPNIAAFIKGDIALVHAQTTLTGTQVNSPLIKPVPFPGFTVSINSSTKKVTYMADLGGGVVFHATGFPVNLTLAGGVQFFGYVPRVENPTTTGPYPSHTKGPAKVVGTAAINPYATLKLTLPF